MNHAKKIAFAALMLLASTTAACSSDPAAAPSTPPPGTTPIVDAGGTIDGSTLPDGGCFEFDGGNPATPEQFLNQCNGGECFKFDNATQIEGFVPGAALPPLN